MTPLTLPWAAVVAYSMVVLVFIGDWITPATVVVGVGYEIPVVYAALKGSQRLTLFTVVLATVGIAICAYIDFAQGNFQYDDARVANRLFSLASVWIVGALALVVQRNANLTERQWNERALRRETSLSTGMDRVMTALSTGTTIQALTGEAPELLDAEAAVWCSTQGDGMFWAALEPGSEAKVLEVKPSASFETLLRRLSAQSSVEVVSAAESIDYLVGRPLGHKDALAIPVGDGSQIVGVVFAAVELTKPSARALVEASNFAKFASTALRAQAGNQLAHHAG